MKDKLLTKVQTLLCNAAGCTKPLELIGKPIQIEANYEDGHFVVHLTAIERILLTNASETLRENFRVSIGLTFIDGTRYFIAPQFTGKRLPRNMAEVDWGLFRVRTLPNRQIKTEKEGSICAVSFD